MSLWHRAAGRAGHEEVRRDGAVDVRVGRRRKERARRARAFLLHPNRNLRRVDDAVLGEPSLVLRVAGDDQCRDAHQRHADGGADGRSAAPFAKATGAKDAGRYQRDQKERRTGRRQSDVRVDEQALAAGGAGREQREPEEEPETAQGEASGAEPAGLQAAACQCQRDGRSQRDPDERMQRDLCVVPQGWFGEARQVRGIQQQQEKTADDQARPRATRGAPHSRRSATADLKVRTTNLLPECTSPAATRGITEKH